MYHLLYFISQQSSTENLLVHITDINDNPPEFTEPEGYYFTVDEGRAGLNVGIVTVNKGYIALTVLKKYIIRESPIRPGQGIVGLGGGGLKYK